jgi:mRNA-degrading endonuclease RelE of RelBE toxin-antitoxin system
LESTVQVTALPNLASTDDKTMEVANEFRKYLEELAEEPYKFPKKKGKLKSCRALSFKVKGNAWRLIFRIIDARDLVEILAIGPMMTPTVQLRSVFKPLMFFIFCKEKMVSTFPNPFC